MKSEIEARLDELLGRMTLEEKVGQMCQRRRLGEEDRDAVRAGQVGSSIFADGAWAGKDMPAAARAEMVNAFQKTAVEESRLGIPLLFARDVIHGHRTVFPIPLGQAAAWNPGLVEQAAAVAAREATCEGVKWFFTPMLDVCRDSRWGRIAEGFGEDPYLASRLAEAAVRGYQGGDPSRPDRVAACGKHYAGYGWSEGGRDYDGVEMSLATLHDVCLPPFEAAVKAGVATVMSAFHDFNGVPVAANRYLLTEILKERWGFEGFVVSDWNAVAELVAHGVAEDEARAAELALRAGVDMEMVSRCYLDCAARLARVGRIEESVVDGAARRILRVKFLAGLFERPYADGSRAGRVTLCDEHRALARRFARECQVLLKNEGGILPLDGRFKTVAVVGPLADAREALFGSWTLDGRGEDVTPVVEALRESLGSGVRLLAACRHADEMVVRARSADVAVVVVGEHPCRSGEAASVSTLELPAGQRELVRAVQAQGAPVVLVVIAGRPLAIGGEAALADAVLYAWHPGVEGGHAIADVLTGAANPCGRLPVTVPRATGQVPVYYNHKNRGRPARPRGFSSCYQDLDVDPLYRFGYGLSYTRFAYRDLELSGETLREDGELGVSAVVENVGQRAGVEVAQLYVRDLVARVTRPVRELKGFRKAALEPGEAERVSFVLRADDLMFSDADGRPTLEGGEYHVWVGPDSGSGLQGRFRLEA